MGQTAQALQRIFDDRLFMNEAHVHGFANRLARDIIVVDHRGELLGLHHYKPGYQAQQQISMHRALELRKLPRTSQPLWVLMSPDHWSALLPK